MILREKIKHQLSFFWVFTKKHMETITEVKLLKKETFTKYIQKDISVKLLQKTLKKYIDYFVNFLRNVSWKSPKTIGVTALVLAAFLGGIFYFSTTTSAVCIKVNGKNVGYVQNKAEAQQIVQEVLRQQGGITGIVAQTSDKIEYNKVRISDAKFAGQKATTALLLSSITPFIGGYGIKIQDKIVACLASAEQADSVLAKYKEHFAKPSEKNIVSSSEFVEEVNKVAVKVQPSEIKSVDDAINLLLKGDAVETTYTVQKDDSWWLIARKNQMLTNEVLAGNPGFTDNTVIKPGQKIKIVKVEPYLTVLAKGTKVVNEVIPFDVETKTSSQIAYGKTVVQQTGKDGEKSVTYNYVEQNGKTVEKQVVKEEVISKSIKQIIAKGPSNRATVYVGTSRGSGNVAGLQWPISGPITSYYGYRSSGFHSGLDIDGVTGQPYAAAASGTVVFSGWDGGYGYCIMIDHGNGVATRYGHSSKLLVGVGDTVSKGQTIGLVGSTGNSTGSHLHFEVIINGSTVNPLNYL